MWKQISGALGGVLCATSLFAAGQGGIHRNPNAVQGEYIVVLRSDIPRDQVPTIAQQIASSHAVHVERIWKYAIKGFFVRTNEAAAVALSHDPDVDFVEENAQTFLSDRVPTRVDPACDGTPTQCATTDNRLGHLDQLDQDTPVPSGDFGFCSYGTGVYVYVIDSGVMRAHREFNNDSTRVVNGYNATGDGGDLMTFGDYYPADDPCHGSPLNDAANYIYALYGSGHGTGVGSMVAGQHVGVARSATIVPIKVIPCGTFAARVVKAATSYTAGQIVYNGAAGYWQCIQTGTTANGAGDGSWPRTGNITSGGAIFEPISMPGGQTVQMIIDGINWILDPYWNPYPIQPAVATLSVYAVQPAGSGASAFETAIGNLLTNNVTVIASANNQGGNACDTAPARLSRNNPSKNAGIPYKVITVGGSMLLNNPDGPSTATNPANGGPQVSSTEPAYDPSRPVNVGRWRCGAGDSDFCTQNAWVDSNIPVAPDPSADPNGYIGTALGSNGGQCVTLFAPAKNIPAAWTLSTTSYHDTLARLVFSQYQPPNNIYPGDGSGTSFSAPIVAGIAARILQNYPSFTPDDVFSNMMNGAVYGSLDSYQLDPPNVTGTPNVLVHTGDLWITTQPANTPVNGSGSAVLSVAASGYTTLTYQWFKVGAGFDINDYHKRAANAVPVFGATSSSITVTPSARTGYFVRVYSDCATTDSNIAVVVPQPAAPSAMRATYSYGNAKVTITYGASANAQVYHLERWVTGGSWQEIQSTTVPAWGQSPPTSLNDSNPPHPADGVVVYRVRASAGELDVPAQIVYSAYSNLDFTFTNAFTDQVLVPYTTPVRAAHLIELRTAVNVAAAAATAAGFSLPPEYTGATLDPASLRSHLIAANDFIDLQTHLNHVRASTAYSLPSTTFTVTPASSGAIRASQLQNLRDGLQ